MRKLLTGVAVVAAALVPLALVAPGAVAGVAAKGKPPVKLPGKVTDKGTAVATGGAIELDQHDFFYAPTFVQIPKNTAALTVTVKNVGSAQHTFTVPADHIDQVLNPGDTMVFNVAIPGNGAFNFYCRFHRSLGMQGAFFDKKGAKLIKTTSTKSGSGSGSSSGGYGY
jgi:plastocyanin